MRIRARFLLTLALSLALSVCIAVVATSFLQRMRSTVTMSQRYEDVIQQAFSLSNLVDSLQLEYSPRIEHQLARVKDSLGNTLAALHPTSAEEEFLLRHMLRNDQDLGVLLEQYLHGAIQADTPAEARRRRLLSSQIRLKVRFITDDTNRLVRSAQDRLMTEQVRAGWIVTLLIAALVIINVLTFSFANRRIFSQIRRLAEGSERIANGDLDQRIEINGKDELTDSANSFNTMAESLQASQASQRLHAQKLEQSNSDLEQFAFLASHDLQEPLRKIQAFGDLLRMEAGDDLSETAQDYLERMGKAAGRMRDLINALLEYSRAMRSQVPLSKVDLGSLVNEVLGDLEARIAEDNASVEVGPLPVVKANPMQMRQLFQNLISNGLKYHRPDTPPEVSISSHCEDEVCHIEVADNGIGMEEQYLDKIFAPFQRLHGRSEYEGTGIGLAVCRVIAERHGGSISVRSTPGSGSTFVVTLPVNNPNDSLSTGVEMSSALTTAATEKHKENV